MKVLYLGILRGQEKDAVELVTERDLSSFNYFTRTTADQWLTFGATLVAGRTAFAEEVHAEKDSNIIHALGRKGGVTGIVITDAEYPEFVATSLLKKMCLQFESTYPLTAIANAKPNSMPFPELKQYIVKYQNPGEADAITKIQKELDETTKTTRLAVEALLDRGEKIDSLVAKSETLSTQSKMFYTQAKKQNSCCIVM